MKSISKTSLGFLFLLLTAAVTHGGAIEKHARFGVTFHYRDYEAALSRFVDDQGLVNYAGLKGDREQLDFFVRDVSGLYRDIYAEWSETDRLAYWINAYNAITLASIIDNYPIKPKWSLRRTAAGGIRDIPDVWTAKAHTAKGDMVSLDDIEHEIVRKQFNEPRIHMALVCAAQSCPPLRNEPYLPEKLDEQLNDQTRKFLANPDRFRLDMDEKVLHLSKIFQWYGQDWIPAYKDKAFTDYGNEAEKAVIAFIAEYLDDAQRESLKNNRYSIKYLKYDWSLNEQPATE